MQQFSPCSANRELLWQMKRIMKISLPKRQYYTIVLYSRTFLAGRALPPWETLAAPIPLQSIVTYAIVTGTFCRVNINTHHCQTNRSHKQSLAAISLAALFLIQCIKLPYRKYHRSITLVSSLPGQKAQEQITHLYFL